MSSSSSLSVHKGRQRRHFHRNLPLPWALVAAGIMALALGVMSASPEDRTQDHEAAGDLELVDVQPPDAGGERLTAEEPDEGTSDTPSAEDSTTEDSDDEDSTTEDSDFAYENCAAARADGAAPVHEGERGFGPHLDADDDGIGCEHWGPPSGAPDDDAYENCDAARADGAAPVHENEPGFGPHLDADNDGIGCE